MVVIRNCHFVNTGTESIYLRGSFSVRWPQVGISRCSPSAWTSTEPLCCTKTGNWSGFSCKQQCIWFPYSHRIHVHATIGISHCKRVSPCGYRRSHRTASTNRWPVIRISRNSTLHNSRSGTCSTAVTQSRQWIHLHTQCRRLRNQCLCGACAAIFICNGKCIGIRRKSVCRWRKSSWRSPCILIRRHTTGYTRIYPPIAAIVAMNFLRCQGRKQSFRLKNGKCIYRWTSVHITHHHWIITRRKIDGKCAISSCWCPGNRIRELPRNDIDRCGSPGFRHNIQPDASHLPRLPARNDGIFACAVWEQPCVSVTRTE